MKRIMFFAFLAVLVCSTCFSIGAKEISNGADYSLVTPASKAYPDDGAKLTDGIYGTRPELADGFYASDAYVGFNKNDVNDNGKFALIIDLGEVKNNINAITVGYLSEIDAGIHAPKSVSFSVSNQRNGNYSLLGTLDTTPEDESVASTYAKTLEIENATGRYILVTITPDDYTGKVDSASIAPWTFIDEISVHAAELTQNPNENGGAATDNKQGNVSTEDEPENPIATEDEKPNDPPEDFPQTGDNTMIIGFTLLLIAAVSMAVVLFGKRTNKC